MYFSSSDPVLSSPFRYPHQSFLWSRLRLFEDRIEFVGLRWTGLHRRTLPLARVKNLRWWTGSGDVNFALLLDGGDDGEDERIYLHVDAAGLWKHEVAARAQNLVADGPDLPKQKSSSDSSPSSSNGKRARAA